ncbi:hypothetical protein TrST_g533 [Triparma strigata]|uniref:Uncharacterized protein n=1 Tax=Triparma strigata TaxID=1606541 RepID=A0A9W7E668_9STRA|nr:hypothetical protein TrST_g533 [Triparma strigata]
MSSILPLAVLVQGQKQDEGSQYGRVELDAGNPNDTPKVQGEGDEMLFFAPSDEMPTSEGAGCEGRFADENDTVTVAGVGTGGEGTKRKGPVLDWGRVVVRDKWGKTVRECGIAGCDYNTGKATSMKVPSETKSNIKSNINHELFAL